MSDAVIQSYIPSMATLIVVALGVLFNNARISEVSARLSDLSTGLNKRIADLRQDNNQRFERIEARMDKLETRFETLQTVLIGKIDEIVSRLDNR